MPKPRMKSIHDQYFDLCRKHCETERDLLLQVGSFFEAYYYNDIGSARIIARELNIILTKKNLKRS